MWDEAASSIPGPGERRITRQQLTPADDNCAPAEDICEKTDDIWWHDSPVFHPRSSVLLPGGR